MSATRRQFLDTLATGAVALGAVSTLPAALGAMPSEFRGAADIRQHGWDTAWPSRLDRRLKAVFDVPEVESGYGVWRATVWQAQYEQVLGIPRSQMSAALVLRHNAIVLAMTQAFWDRYGVAEVAKATHPLTTEPTKRNPALLGKADGVDEPYASFALDRFLAAGGIALACNLALQDMAALVAKVDGVGEAEAMKRARDGMVPGVILQPSGVFAVFRAQEAGAMYLRAS